MKSIPCYLEEYIKTYYDEEGNKKTKTYGAKDWQLGNYIRNGTKEGIKQRTHEELMMLRGEVIGKENDYGVDWETYFEKRASFYNDDKIEQEGVRNMFIKDVKEAIMHSGNVVEVRHVIFPEVQDNKKMINCGIFIIYTNIDDELDILQYDLQQ